MISKKKRLILKIILCSIFIGALVGVLELFIGHRYILDPLLYDKDPGFVYESYFAPTYYGFSKSITVAFVSFLVLFFGNKFKIKLKPVIKAAIIGLIGTLVFGIYYHFTFPTTTSSSSAIIGIVHFSFMFLISYPIIKLAKLKL